VGNFFTLWVGFVEHDHTRPKLADRWKSHSSLLSSLKAEVAPWARKRKRQFVFVISIFGIAILDNVVLDMTSVVLPFVPFVTEVTLQVG
jgi:hypothetical protein